MSRLTKQLLRTTGNGLAVAGVGFVVWRFYRSGALVTWEQLKWSTVALIISLMAAYALASVLLGLAWRSLLMHWGCSPSARCAIGVHGISQLAKYLPGNVFQFVGRQSLGVLVGVPSSILLRSAAWELAMLVVAGAAFTPLVLPVVIPNFSVMAAAVGSVLTSLVLALALRRFCSAYVQKTLILHIMFLFVSAAAFVILYYVTTNTVTLGNRNGLALIGAYVTAWLIGLATPGAPAGMGVRETVLVFLTKSLVPEADLLVIVAMNRIVTIGGDFGYFGIAQWLQRSTISHPSHWVAKLRSLTS